MALKRQEAGIGLSEEYPYKCTCGISTRDVPALKRHITYAKKNNGNLQIVKISDCGNRPIYWDTILENIKPYLVESVPCDLEKWYELIPTMYDEIDPLTSQGKYLYGYLQSSKYFEEYKEDIKSLFINHKLLHFIDKYDYLLITTNKTKTDIFNELNKIIL
jgi:hypothetical protein